MSEPVQIPRDEYLRENGWTNSAQGWVKIGGFGHALNLDAAYQLQALLDTLDGDDVEYNPSYMSNTPRTDRLGRPLRPFPKPRA